ncbi:MAG: DUF4252 domain-containing protein [Proteobacteria bacterium]|nr:DUF4252 domain-containing protein [Pseudomonadota bacterium]
MKNIIILMVLVVLGGCMTFTDRPLRPIRDSITQQLPELRLEKQFAVSIGSGLLNFLDVITFNEADLSDLDHVQLAVYRLTAGWDRADFSNLNFEQTLLAKNSRLHWDTIVRIRNENSQVWVLIGMDLNRGTLDAVSVFVLQQDELVLINVDGDFDRLLEFALQPVAGHRGVVKVI